MESAIKQYHFLVAVRATPQYQKYYGKHTMAQKSSLDDFFGTYCTHKSFEKMGMLTKTMRNELIAVIQNSLFDKVFDDVSAKELADMIRVRFNMNREPSPEHK
eukprot:12289225-Ditylum_brightwellii.AAC.1